MIVAGTRPEAIKLAPVFWWLDKLGVDYVFVWSGQHYDYEMSRVFFEQLHLPEPVAFLNVGIQASDVSEQVGILIHKIATYAKQLQPDIIYALGDTNTTLAAALASTYVGRPFIHDEAGVRSFDMAMLEEVNRRVADAVADFRLAPTKLALLNLLYEGASSTTIKLVGSTAIDTLLYILSSNMLREDVFNELEVEPGNYILFTLHRRENLTAERLRSITALLTEVAKRKPDVKIVFPIHPHTSKRMKELKLEKVLKKFNNIIMTKPLGYLEFITLLKKANVVITDSGGVQEEAYILGKKTITLRDTTEWFETVVTGYNLLVRLDQVQGLAMTIITHMEKPDMPPPNLSTCPLGDGKAGMRIARTLKGLLERGLKKRREEGFKLPQLTASRIDSSICFSQNGLPALEKDHIVCVTRTSIEYDKLRNFIEVNWAEIDKEK